MGFPVRVPEGVAFVRQERKDRTMCRCGELLWCKDGVWLHTSNGCDTIWCDVTIRDGQEFQIRAMPAGGAIVPRWEHKVPRVVVLAYCIECGWKWVEQYSGSGVIVGNCRKCGGRGSKWRTKRWGDNFVETDAGTAIVWEERLDGQL
jgi:hypothetical protein